MKVVVDNAVRRPDSVDLRILVELQRQGRMQNKELAASVGLTESSCLRRVRRLEQNGFIKGYVAVIDPESMSITKVSMVLVRLEYYDAAIIRRFTKVMRDEPGVLECHAIAGSFAYLVKFGAAQEEVHEQFYDQVVRKLPGVVNVTSPMFLDEVKKWPG